MAAVVIDANLAVGLVRQMPYSLTFRRQIERWLRDEVRLAVPGLWDYEVATVLRKLWVQGVLTGDQAIAAVEMLMRLPVEHYPADTERMVSALRWAERLGQSKAYDAHYVALAEQLGRELWSADQRLINALHARGVSWAHWIGEV